ncbi:hypothetical protein Pla123a_39130 [Posidoniimonas polymericola]|uniref:Uncharacterized protein n=1 Tax=Posidoniimonas polymericola TaxID=2528002 RepID=A0A5C5YCZ0_9BACT|nr:hypothetical protein Pla123a_39130 [Posidoniimonas polymericola]
MQRRKCLALLAVLLMSNNGCFLMEALFDARTKQHDAINSAVARYSSESNGYSGYSAHGNVDRIYD